jgi:response regulator RpfG family c-di-GMP phosphodiesterase
LPNARAWPAETVREYIGAQAGLHFDPALTTAFLAMEQSDAAERPG